MWAWIALVEGVALGEVARRYFGYAQSSDVGAALLVYGGLGLPLVCVALRKLMPNLLNAARAIALWGGVAVVLYTYGREIDGHPVWIPLKLAGIGSGGLVFCYLLLIPFEVETDSVFYRPPTWRYAIKEWISSVRLPEWPRGARAWLFLQLRSARTERPNTERTWDERSSESSTQQVDSEFDRAWATLGVAPTADRKAIKAAYRARMLAFHPDRLSGLDPLLRELAEREAKAVNHAYDLLLRRR